MKINSYYVPCILAVSMLAIPGCAVVDAPDGAGAASNDHSTTAMAGLTGPTGGIRATGSTALTGSTLPLAIHGAAFIPINLSSGTIANYGANGMQMGGTSTATGALTSASLVAGTTVTQITIRVIDSALGASRVGATFGDANSTIFFSSGLSNASGTQQTLVITPTSGFQTVAGDSYWIAINRVSGTGSWQVVDATIQ